MATAESGATLKSRAVRREGGYYEVPVGLAAPARVFMTPSLFEESESVMWEQMGNVATFPGVRDVVVTPDAHLGYGVPVGCVLATDGTLCMGPVGYDIGCGMMCLRSTVDKAEGLDDRKRREFSRRVMARIGLGAGRGGTYHVDRRRFEEIVRGGATALGVGRGTAERDSLPVDDEWTIPPMHKGGGIRGVDQIGSLGGGNHFCELQHDQDDHLWIMVHTGSRGFGHGLATHYFREGAQLRGLGRGKMDLVYFTPEERLWRDYRNAVHAGGNFAIVNRLVIAQKVSQAFEEVFGQEPEFVYEISHNLAQLERHPGLGEVWIHRKGATRALPAGHPLLSGTPWEATGHPILIPGSMGDTSYVLFAEPGAERSLYSINHGCGRRLGRREAKRRISQQEANEVLAARGVTCNAGGNVPIDESPACYKPAAEVIRAVTEAGLARVAWELRPIASIKGTD